MAISHLLFNSFGCGAPQLLIYYRNDYRREKIMLKCASFFAGVGGIDYGFENTGVFKTVYANEFDSYPAKTFELNYDIKVDVRDIHEVRSDEIPDFDIMLAGFP